MTEAQRVFFERDGSAQNVKAGSGAKLANKSDAEAARRKIGKIAQAEIFDRRQSRVRQPIEVIGNRKMFGHIALPRGDDRTTGLDPGSHRASFQNWLGAPIAWDELIPYVNLPI